jgi:multidrug efflux system outer membrane protein
MKRLAPLALIAALIGGCSLDPAYHRPTGAVPASFPQGPSYAPPAAGPTAAALSWRAFFTDPDLKAVIELALAQNRDLRAALANIQSAKGQVAVQRSALLPNLNATGGELYQQSPNPFGGAGAFDERYYSAGLGFSSWEIDLFGHTRSLTRAAFDQYLASQDARRAVQVSLIAQVATAWFTLAADRDLLAVARQTLAAQQDSLDLTRARFNAGVASMLDVSQAETTVEQARSDVASFTTNVAQDKNALDLLVGAPTPEARLPKTLPSDGGVAGVQAGVSSDVLLSRPDVLEAEHQLLADEANIGAARAAFFPQIDLTGQVGQESTALQSLFSAAARTWLFQPNLSVPVFSAGRNMGSLKAAKAQREAALAQYEKAIQSAFSDVANALARQGTIGDQLSAQQALAKSAAEALALTNARYQRGTDPYLNVLVAQRTFYSAQQSLVSTQLTRLSNVVSLYRALGGGQN